MPRGLLKIQDADGSTQDVPEKLGDGSPNPLYESKWAAIDAGTELGGAFVGPDPAHGIPAHHLVLDAGALAKMVNEEAASKAIQDEIDSRTVMVTIDDSVMEKTEEPFELQVVPGPPEFATVKTRMVAQRGIANPNHVTVETLADFEAGQP